MIQKKLRYTTDHEWIQADGNSATVGITDYAQSQLGDITYVELPAKGKTAKAGEALAVVESVKAASDVFAPVGGTVSEVNEDLDGCPDKVNSDPYKDGWLFSLSDINQDELSSLMDSVAYEKFIENGSN